MGERERICLHCCEPAGAGAVCQRCGMVPGQVDGDDAMRLEAGAVLQGRYLVGRELGRGGFGITYLARDLQLRVRVAVKEYYPRSEATRSRDGLSVRPCSGGEDAYREGLRSFIREAQMVAQLRDAPNVVTIFDVFTANGTGYMVMQYLAGRTAEALRRARGGRLAEEEALPVIMAVLDGLRAVHELRDDDDRGLIHRDVKPANIYVTRDGPVVLLDFGAARYTTGRASQALSHVLTDGYAPPEQYNPRATQDQRTDVYAAGATLWALLAGEIPTPALLRRAGEELPPLSRFAHVSPAVSAALEVAMHLDPAVRWPTARAFQRSLLEPEGLVQAVPVAPLKVEESPAPPGAAKHCVPETALGAPASEPVWWTEAIKSPRISYTPDSAPSREPVAAAGPKTLRPSVAPPPPKRREPPKLSVGPAAAAIDRVSPHGSPWWKTHRSAGLVAVAGIMAVGGLLFLDTRRGNSGGGIEGVAVSASSRDPNHGYVRLPSGSYEMGSATGDSDERPVRVVQIRGFELAKSETTVGDYRRCVEDGPCTAPGTFGSCNWGRSGREDHPVNCVDWEQAKTYCEWAGARLPSEAEWEYAARSSGRDQEYPWGSEKATCARAVMNDGGGIGCGRGDTTWEVCLKMSGNSAQGACDLAGNVWEWVEDTYHESYSGAPADGSAWVSGGSGRVVRGGGCYDGASLLRASFRDGDDPSDAGGFLGFRCSRSLAP
ncbi:MAG: hypothetical protein AMXMBFR64_62630 [Myxococcales bacterium]